MVAHPNGPRGPRIRHRRALRTASAAALAAPLALTAAAADGTEGRTASGLAPPASALVTDDPPGPTGGIDGDALRYRLQHEVSDDARTASPQTDDATRVQEEDAGDTVRDRGASAQRLPGSPDARAAAGWEVRVDGGLGTAAIEPEEVAPNPEDDGSLSLARDLGLGAERRGITTDGVVGDGPHGSEGSATGDFDFYRVDAARGETLTVDLAPEGALAPNALLYDADGELLVGAQDMTGDGAVHLAQRLETGGTYYVAVGAYLPGDPTDPASGPGVVSEGPYSIDVTLHARGAADTDVYAVPLRRGDVVGASVSGGARQVALHELDGDLVQSSASDPGPIYPDGSPLPRGGNATANHVVDRTGLYLVAVSDGAGDYELTVGAHRAPSARGAQEQTVLLDFSGPSFDNRVFGAAVTDPGVRDVSPMRDFLPRWGLTAADERAVVDATTALVRQTLRDEIPGSRVRVTNDREDPDLWGAPGVSRVIVGGTVAEAGIMPAFGLSESIDPGNFAREETAIVMPELMSGDHAASLDRFLTADSDRVQAVSQALGYTAAHEIGHFVGNFHTDDHDVGTSVMNTGNLLHMFAVGPDGVAGTADDDHVAMRTARYDRLQGISGVEDTVSRTAVALR
ncbi:hypothetical protein ACFQ8E_18110 [Isoptericola sp. NPDC056573]|uniref:hypothetical protein n=1 Tax=Isoptericola sp. NPDC056573 TaxID=3345868 RepID=UPI0036BF009B